MSATAVQLIDDEAVNHDFLCNQQPSLCMCPTVGWIWARRIPRRPGSRSNVDTTKTGKWMLYASAESVDLVWATVKSMLANGDLGSVAKVATKNSVGEADRRGAHLICVYTENFADVPDVFRVLCTLRDSGLPCAAWDQHYKTDEATLAGVYSNSQTLSMEDHTNSRVSLYSSPRCSTVETGAANGTAAGRGIVELVRNNIGPMFYWDLIAERLSDGITKCFYPISEFRMSAYGRQIAPRTLKHIRQDPTFLTFDRPLSSSPRFVALFASTFESASASASSADAFEPASALEPVSSAARTFSEGRISNSRAPKNATDSSVAALVPVLRGSDAPGTKLAQVVDVSLSSCEPNLMRSARDAAAEAAIAHANRELTAPTLSGGKNSAQVPERQVGGIKRTSSAAGL